MKRPSDQHLDDAEIASLQSSSSTGLPESTRASQPSHFEAELHFQTCAECRQRVRMYEETRGFFRSLRQGEPLVHFKCSVEADWFAVAGGLIDQAEALPLIEHAARCSRCGPQLKAAVDDLSEDVTPEEAEFLAELPSSASPGQQKIVQRLIAEIPKPDIQPLRAKPSGLTRRLGTAAAAVLLIGLATLVARHFLHEASPADLIAQAYTADRTFELRIPGANHALPKTQRAASTSNLDRPATLLRAESTIAEGLRKSPNDVALLHAETQADLLDGNYEHAIATAQRALEGEPDSVAVLLDLSTAYFLRAQQNGDDEHDYALAIEYQGKVLGKEPGNVVALFNRAISEDKALLYDDAANDWKKFLATETDPAWRAEGKRRYDELLQRMRRSDRSGVAPVQDLAQVAKLLRTHAQSGSDASWPTSRDEVYFDVAMRRWLGGEVEEGATEALAALAEEFKQRHNDPWLGELLSSSHTKRMEEGVRELSLAIASNAKGQSDEGISHARIALAAFRTEGNEAGVTAASFALSRGLSRGQQGKQCLPVSVSGLKIAQEHRYLWMATRLMYEASTCSSLDGNPQMAEQYAKLGKASATAAGFSTLTLIGSMFLDGVDSPNVARSESWSRMRAGLVSFWEAPYPALCGGEFYDDLNLAARTEQLWNFAEAAGEETVAMFAQEDDRVVKAASYASLARDALAAGDGATADMEFDKSATLFSTWGESTQAAYATLEIERASSELRRGLLQKAGTRLEKVRGSLSSFADNSAQTLFHETLGELYLRSGKLGAAEAELLEAIGLVEKSKNSLSVEEEFLAWQLDESQAYRLLLEIYSTRKQAEARSLAFLEWYWAEPLRVDAADVKKLEVSTLGKRRFPETGEAELSRALVALRPAGPVLAWASFPSDLVIWEVDDAGVHRFQVDVDAQTLHATAQRFARMCADPGSDTNMLHRDARQLYTWLIAPVAGRLPPSGLLTLEPDPSLRGVAFAALQDPGDRYLGDDFTVVESPGLLYARTLRPSKPIGVADRALAVGDPSSGALAGARLSRLPEADREAQEVSALFSSHFLLRGDQATLANVTRLLPQAQVFHFAGHTATRAREPGLLLASPGQRVGTLSLLGATELSPKYLDHLQLAVLSGCETAVSDQGMVDPASLVRIFLRSGVPHVVASKWRIDSNTSAETMGTMYTELLRGTPLPAALADAERAIRSNPATAHPYYWAAFSAFGA